MKPNLDIFAATLMELAEQDRNLLVVTSDARGSGRLDGFARAFPKQVVEMGIAEQNLVGVAAGLASTCKKVFAVSPACFLTARALEQIKNDVAYSDHPVTLVGISAGVSYGALGSTHHSLHDLAALQAIPNLDIIVPADNFETREAVRLAVAHPRPLYLRFGKRPVPDLHPAGTRFSIGKAIPLSSGSDVTFIACGEMVWRAARAAELLGKQQLSCGVISLHTLNPFDGDTVLKAAQHSRLVITVEEHSQYGGLGGRCAQLLMQAGVRACFHVAAIPVEPTVSGSQDEILTHYRLDPQGLFETAMRLLEKDKKA